MPTDRLLIAPEGIEINLIHTKKHTTGLLIAPEGIEMSFFS